jgi:hypothetical protein
LLAARVGPAQVAVLTPPKAKGWWHFEAPKPPSLTNLTNLTTGQTMN